MAQRRWPRRSAGTARPAKRTLLLLMLLLASAAAVTTGLIFRSLMTEIAASSARDTVVLAVNGIVEDIMSAPSFDPAGLVRLEKDAGGAVTAVSTDVAAVNTLAARVLELAVAETAEKKLTVKVPMGNLTGSTLLLGKGPTIPVEVVMLSSSTAGFRSELTSAGINQTRHQILLDLHVEVSLLMPWRAIGDRVDTEILVSETVIVGEVPESYMNWTTGGPRIGEEPWNTR